MRCGAIVASHDADLRGAETGLEIRSHGRNEDDEEVLRSGFDAYLRTGTDEQRADVKRRSAAIRRHEALVKQYDAAHGLFKLLHRQLGHHNGAAGGLEALSVLVHAKDTDASVLAHEGLQALKGLLAIVQAGGSHVNVDVFRRGNLEFTPRAIAVITSHIVIRLHVTKRNLRPIDFFHGCVSFLMCCINVWKITTRKCNVPDEI